MEEPVCFHILLSDQYYLREIYHAPRMQQVLSVIYSSDSKYVMSGSDEMNIRLWKAHASEKLGPVILNLSLRIFF